MARTALSRALPWLCLLGVIGTASAADVSTHGAPVGAPVSEEERSLYTLGQLISRTLDTFELTAAELAQVQAGLADGVLNRPPQVDLAAEAPRLPALQASRRERAIQRERDAAQSYLQRYSEMPGSERTASGILLQPLQSGHGPAPTDTDHVSVHYEGALVDGTVFESSRQRGEPATLPVKGVIACWTEALQRMRVGARQRVICPPELAYGERGSPPVIRPGATLVFDIELLAIVR